MKQSENKTTAIEKVLKVMMAFTSDADEEKGTVELSQELGLNKATVSRIANTLADHGFLLRNSRTKKFRHGQWLLSLGLSATKHINKNLINIAKPFVDELQDILNETITFSVLYGRDVIVGYVAEKPGLISLSVRLGRIVPIHAAASAKAIYAFLPPQMVETVFQQDLPSFSPNTITDPEILKQQFKKFRKQGYATDYEELHIGLNTVSIPVFNFEKNPIAAVSVVGLPSKLERGGKKPIISQLKRTSQKISEQLFNNIRPVINNDQ